MRNAGQRIMYTYRGPGREVPWAEIRRALHEQLTRDGTFALTITCDHVTGGTTEDRPQASSDFAADAGKAGRQATIWDVAREAQVSVATVSRVLNNRPHVGQQTQLRIEAAMERLGFQPNEAARAMVRNRQGRIAEDGAEIAFAENGERVARRADRAAAEMSGGAVPLMDKAS